MKIELDNSVGLALLNLIRCTALSHTQSVRPVAFKVTDCNVLSLTDLVEEDSIEFGSNLNSLIYKLDSEEELFIWSGKVNGILTPNELQTSNFFVLDCNACKELVHTFSEVEFTIYFRKSVGRFTREENLDYLKEQDIDTSNLVVLPSRHTCIENFSFKEVIRNYDTTEYDLSITTNDNSSEEFVVSESLEYLNDEIQKILFKL